MTHPGPPGQPDRPDRADAKTPASTLSPVPEEGPADAITLRPDGYYWRAPDGRQEFGPFESHEAAWADLHASDADAPEPGETLREAESEIGVADWIDPETGEPAEGQSPPHLDPD